MKKCCKRSTFLNFYFQFSKLLVIINSTGIISYTRIRDPYYIGILLHFINSLSLSCHSSPPFLSFYFLLLSFWPFSSQITNPSESCFTLLTLSLSLSFYLSHMSFFPTFSFFLFSSSFFLAFLIPNYKSVFENCYVYNIFTVNH